MKNNQKLKNDHRQFFSEYSHMHHLVKNRHCHFFSENAMGNEFFDKKNSHGHFLVKMHKATEATEDKCV